MSTEPPGSSALVASLARGPLIGTFIGLILYGFTCLQAVIYFQTYIHDRRGLKMTVALVIILETVHVVLTMWVIDDYLVSKYGEIEALQTGTWPSTFTYIIGLLIDFVVYIYFTWRIWRFTGKRWIVIFMSMISVSRTAISIVPCLWSVLSPSWTTYLGKARNVILVGNSLFIIGDTFSAAIMAYYLRKNRIGNHPTDHLINRLVIFAAATGALTSLVDILALIFTLAQPQSLAFMGPILVQTRLYANSFLTSLNLRNAHARAYEDARNPHDETVELPPISIQFARPSSHSMSSEHSERANIPDKQNLET